MPHVSGDSLCLQGQLFSEHRDETQKKSISLFRREAPGRRPSPSVTSSCGETTEPKSRGLGSGHAPPCPPPTPHSLPGSVQLGGRLLPHQGSGRVGPRTQSTWGRRGRAASQRSPSLTWRSGGGPHASCSGPLLSLPSPPCGETPARLPSTHHPPSSSAVSSSRRGLFCPKTPGILTSPRPRAPRGWQSLSRTTGGPPAPARDWHMEGTR